MLNDSREDPTQEGWDDDALLAGLEAAGASDHTDRFDPEGVLPERRLGLAEELLRRGWIDISHPLRGDGALIEARGVRLTETGLAMRDELRKPSVFLKQAPDADTIWSALRGQAEAGSELERSIQLALSGLADRGMLRSGIAIRRAHAVAAEHGLVWDPAAGEFVPEYLVPPKLDSGQREIVAIAAEMFMSSGEWPGVRDVVRVAIRDREVDSPHTAISSLPESVGHSDAVTIVLTAEGLAATEFGGDLLRGLVGVARIAADAYFGDDDRPTISAAVVHDTLSLDDDTLARLHTLLKTESFFLGSGQSNDDGWEYEVTANAAQLRDCESIDDYLRVRRSITQVPAMPTAIPQPLSEGQRAVREAPIRRLGVQALHPAVLEASSDLFTDGHYSQAIFEAFKALEVRVREQSGMDASGRDLMNKAFSGGCPAIDLREQDGRSGEDEQEGFRFIFMGVIQGIRNPKGHDVVRQGSPDRAIEYLALASLLFHRLDRARRKPGS